MLKAIVAALRGSNKPRNVVSVTGNGNSVDSTNGSNTVIGDGNVVSVGGCAYNTPSRVRNAKTTTVIVGKNCITGYGRINLTTNLGLHQVKVRQDDRTSTIEIDGSQVHFNSPLSHQDGFDHTVNGVRIRISGHTVVIA